ncbi:hypothetical protein Tco_0922071 [Tanacetum coccineum]|uniref:Aminotransferase-like plant mobile domain-containing protein n=1 Tax=Tanacetum coccineum TaxID=301880 RepID=A0ABQ5CZU0_9ASTR
MNQVCTRFILEFYSQYQLSYSDEGEMFVEFVIQNQLFSYSLENFAQILGVPCEGACVFSDRWRVDELIYGIPTDVLTREIEPSLKPLEEIIWENVFCLGGNRDHVPACLCFMLYCVVHSEKFNLAYYMAKRMEWVTKQARLLLPYGMLLTRLFTFIMNENPELNNESYVLYDHVMTPLAAQLEQKPRRDRGMRRGRYSTSSSSAFDKPSSSHLNDDDDYENDEGTSRASTPSPIRYVNSLTDQVNRKESQKVVEEHEEVRYEECFKDIILYFLLNTIVTLNFPTTSFSSQVLLMHIKPHQQKKPSSSHENTSASPFQSKLQISPTPTNEPTSPQTQNLFLQNLMDVPPRPSNPQPLQSIPSLDITLSLSPITPLENPSSPPSPPSPQPPIMGHPLYYNYHDYHGSTCVCCFHNRNLHLNLRDEMNIMFAHLEYL